MKYSRRALEVLVMHFLREYGNSLDPGFLQIFLLNAMLRITNDGPDGVLSICNQRRIEHTLIDTANGTSWLAQVIPTAPKPSSV
jgi:hypothetical protein